MRFLILISLALAALAARAAEPAQPYPLWDGHETIAEYAKRANLEPTRTLELGDGVKLELVLIPAGKFMMGTPEPEAVDEEAFCDRIQMGQAALALTSGVLVVMLVFVLIRAIREKHRPQVSLARLMVLAIISGAGLLGGLHWHYSARALADAQSEYQVASARFRSSDNLEKPAHEETLTTPYYIGKFEVTQEQYQQVTGTNPSNFKGRDLPVETVSWDEAQAFCEKIGEKTGASVRLPSEAEWEYACRAGTRTRFCSGDADADLESVAWYGANSSGKTHPVGGKASNAWGVHDMHGNAWEWCADRFETYKADAVVDPQGPTEGAGRVLRGGSWYYYPWHCRSAVRIGFIPGIRGSFGFRVVWLVPRTR